MENDAQKHSDAGVKDPSSHAPTAESRRAPGPQPIAADDNQVITCYANFCRVTGTPEEMIVDFGLNTQSFGPPTQPVKLQQRIVINFYTAKRLLGALQMAVQTHEHTFGVLETDVQKRVLPQAR